MAVAGLAVAFAGCTKEVKGTSYQPPPTWSVSGTVSGAVAAGVTVRVVGRNKSAVTGAGGAYTIAGLANGTYTLEASLAGYAFTPATRSVSVSGANVVGQDFSAAVGIAISGAVTGAADAAVTLTLTGPAPATTTTTTTTDATGNYAFPNVVAGVYSVTPSLAGGWTFTPANSLVTVVATSLTGPNFTAIAPTHAISGQVSGAVTAGVPVLLSGAADAVAVTDATGRYEFDGLVAGAYAVTPSRDGFAFTPGTQDVALLDADVTGQDFVAVAVHRIAGWISGDVAEGVSVRVTGGAGAVATDVTVETDAAGNFEVSGLADGTYDVTPSLAGYTFNPTTRAITIAAADVTDAAYVASFAPTFSVAGSVSGAVLAGVTVILEGTTTALTTTTDAAGAFALTGVPAGDYMLIPALEDYVFAPASRVVAVSAANVVGQTFAATVSPTARTISGGVSGVVGAGVNVALSGIAPVAPTVTVATDAAGRFAFRNLTDGLYLVTPTLAGGFAFTPANCLVTVAGPSVTNVEFTSQAVPRAISGRVSGAVAAGVTVTLSGGATSAVVTGADGSYTFPAVPNGSYTVTPSLAGYVFGPAEAAVTLAGADVTGVDFVSAATHLISGWVSGAVTAGVAVELSGAATAAVVTDPTGYYQFTVLADGHYLVTPSLQGYTFDPDVLPVALAGADVTGANFVATLVPTYTASGTVSGAIVSGVTLSLSGAKAATTSTDPTGAWAFPGLEDGSYMVIPSAPGYTFDPASRAFRISGANVSGQAFAAQVAP